MRLRRLRRRLFLPSARLDDDDDAAALQGFFPSSLPTSKLTTTTSNFFDTLSSILTLWSSKAFSKSRARTTASASAGTQTQASSFERLSAVRLRLRRLSFYFSSLLCSILFQTLSRSPPPQSCLLPFLFNTICCCCCCWEQTDEASKGKAIVRPRIH